MRPNYPILILLAALVTFSIVARPAMADSSGLGGGNSNQWSQIPGAGAGKGDRTYPMGNNWAWSFIFSPSGIAIVAALVTSVAVVAYMISHKIIKREDSVAKYVDRWESSEEEQEEALDYISKAKKKKTAQGTSVDNDPAGN